MVNITIVFSIILLLCLATFAQTEQELTEESEKFYQNYLSQNLVAVSNDVKTKGSYKAAPVLRVDPLNPTILFDMGYVTGNVGNTYRNLENILIYRNYIRMMPNSVDGYWNFATYLGKSGYVGEADKYYAKANELDPNPVYASHYWRGVTAFLAGNYKQCAESMEKASALTPENGDHRWTYGYLSLCQRAVGNKKNADMNLQKAISIGGDEVKNNIEIETGEYLSASPKNCDDVEKMRREYADKDYYRVKERVKEYREFIKLRDCHPNDGTVSSFGSGLADKIPDLKYWKVVYEARREKARNPGQNPFDEVSEKEKQDFFSPKFRELGLLFGKRQYEQALDLSAKILLFDPQNSQIHNIRAMIFLEIPDLRPLAWREATTALAIEPKSPDARLVRARIYYELKNNKNKALAEIAEAVKVMGNTYAEPYFMRGKIYYAEKEFARAVSDLDTALKIEPNHKEAAYFKKAALNQNLDPRSVISARNKEKEANVKINELTVKINSSKNNYIYNLKQNYSKEARCRLSRAQEKDIKLFQNQFKELEGQLSPYYEYRENLRSSFSTLEENLKLVQNSIQENCQK